MQGWLASCVKGESRYLRWVGQSAATSIVRASLIPSTLNSLPERSLLGLQSGKQKAAMDQWR